MRSEPPPPQRFWWDDERIDPDLVPDPILGDGHVHSDFSGDGNHPALAMMNRAKELGADFVWITDHTRTPTNPGGAPEAMMGSTLPPRPTLRLRIRANIDRGNERWAFRLYTNRDARFDSPARGACAAATDAVNDGNVQQWEPTLDATGVHWVVAYASPDTGPPGPGTQYLVSAPIWPNNR